MNLADKPVHPFQESGRWSDEDMEEGITYKEALVLALAGNSALLMNDGGCLISDEAFAKVVTLQADAIIKQMEKG